MGWRSYILLMSATAVAASAPPLRAQLAPDYPGGYAAAAGGDMVAWRTWGPQVFQEARERGLPMLVDIGTTWCHPCRRMAQETYADPGVAAMINENFVPLRIDADRHPHLNARFQASMYELRQLTGLPLTGFLSDEGRMFVGGTYYGADDSDDGYTGLRTLGLHVSRQYQEDKREYYNTAEEIANLLLQGAMTGDAAGTLLAYRRVAPALVDGPRGLGSGVRMPQWPAMLLAVELGVEGNADIKELGERALHRLAGSGLRDLLAGGFHRVRVSAESEEPHYEKLLALNAGLLETYAVAGHRLGVERFTRAAHQSADFLLGTLLRDRGGLYNAQAADLGPGDDGSAYSWTMQQIDATLTGAERDIVVQYFGLMERDAVRGRAGKALAVRRDLTYAAERAGLDDQEALTALFAAIDKLRAARAARPAPPVDRTLYSSGNGLAAHALLVAGRLLGRDEATGHGLRTLDLFLDNAWDPKRGFARGLRDDGSKFGDGLLEDQVFLGAALVAAYEETGKQRYLDAARAALDLAYERYRDHGHGGLLDLPYERSSYDSVLIIPERPVRDGLLPGANAAWVLAAERLDVAPAACLVIEDSPNGVLAARAAGIRCVAVPNGVTRILKMPETELVVESFEGLGLDEILNRI